MLYALDTYFEYVANRMANVVNPNRKVVAIMDAADWPSKQILMESFYLLVLGQKPIQDKSFWSSEISVYAHTLQWTWLIQGADLTQGKIGRNRGDRYRTNMTMREELIKATYPWFTGKQKWSVVGNTPSGIALEGTLVTPAESIWWTKPTFLNRVDRESGIVYGTGTVQVVDMTETVTA